MDTLWCRNGQHSWEVWSGDNMNCINCDAEGVVHVTFQPDFEEDAQ